VIDRLEAGCQTEGKVKWYTNFEDGNEGCNRVYEKSGLKYLTSNAQMSVKDADHVTCGT
jgi:hypothetical protein